MDERQKAIANLDQSFSLFVRLRYSNYLGICHCITCGKPHFYLNIDNGHYISRSNMGTRFEIKNNRPQCRYCNRTKNGEIQVFALRLVEIYGPGILDELNALSKSTVKYTTSELKELNTFYRGENRKLKKFKDL